MRIIERFRNRRKRRYDRQLGQRELERIEKNNLEESQREDEGVVECRVTMYWLAVVGEGGNEW